MCPAASQLLSAARTAMPAVTMGTPSTSRPVQQQQKYKVGVVDFEYDEDDDGTTTSTGDVGRRGPTSSPENGSPVNHHRHLTGSIFYPSGSSARRSPPRWSPTFHYTHSYIAFASRFSPDHDKPLFRARTVLVAAASHGLLLATNVRVAADAGRAAPPLKGVPNGGSGGEGEDARDGDEGQASRPPLPRPPFPAVVFSHGLGGTRGAYSSFASALASEGFCVLAIEHADGTASAARLAGSRGWRGYERWRGGTGGGEQTARRGEARRAELAAAARVMRALATGGGDAGGGRGAEGDGGGDAGGGRRVEGDDGVGSSAAPRGILKGLTLEGERLPLDFFVGAIDEGAAPAVVGHSYGGALATDAACGEGDLFCCGVALDPWWFALPPGSPAAGDGDGDGQSRLGRCRRRAPLLVLGSEAWNTPNADTGELACGGQLQESVLRTFASTPSSRSLAPPSSSHGGGGGGSGALFAVLKGSSHAGFSDVVSLLPGLSKWFYGRRRRKQASKGGGRLGGGGAGAAEEEEGTSSSSAVDEATDPASTARAAAAITAAFLRRRTTARLPRQSLVAVDDDDRRSIEEAAGRCGVALRGVRVV